MIVDYLKSIAIGSNITNSQIAKMINDSNNKYSSRFLKIFADVGILW